MKALNIVILIALLPCRLFASNTDSVAKAHFYSAKTQLENMLNGKEMPSFEKAIFLIENAWWEGGIDYTSYERVLTLQSDRIKRLAYSYRDKSKVFVSDLSGTKEQKEKRYSSALTNFAIYQYMTSLSLWDKKDEFVCHKPYAYSKKDPMGSMDWTNTQITHLINEGNGNCFALASLFRILSERLNSDAMLCTAPSHIYIRHADEKGTYYNVELSSRAFPGTGTIETLTYTPDEATRNNIALRELTVKQSIALCLVYLAKGYEHKFNTKEDEFILACAEATLKYDDHNLNAMLLKAEVLENRLVKHGKEIQQIQNQKEFKDYQLWITHIYKLGYREMPFEMKNILVKGWTKDTLIHLAAIDHTPKSKNSKIQPTRYASLSWGLFDEQIKTKPFERYGNTVFDTKRQVIVAFLDNDILYNSYDFDPVVFAWNIDPLAHEFPHQSPYSAFGNNPIYNIDVGGAFQYPADKAASYKKDYPMITKYLANNVQNDVLSSTAIVNGMAKYSEGNLTRAQIAKDTKWGEKGSPMIVFNPDLKSDETVGFYGRYDAGTNTINLSMDMVNRVEGILAGDGSMEDKQAALYEFFGTLTHEEVHRGDYLDGKRQTDMDASGWGGEPGSAFMQDVFESKDVDAGGEKIRVNIGSIHGDSKTLIKEQKASGNGSVIPTVPSK